MPRLIWIQTPRSTVVGTAAATHPGAHDLERELRPAKRRIFAENPPRFLECLFGEDHELALANVDGTHRPVDRVRTQVLAKCLQKTVSQRILVHIASVRTGVRSCTIAARAVMTRDLSPGETLYPPGV